jgi:hypothetical protein
MEAIPMIKVKLQSWEGPNNAHMLVDERVIARDLTYDDALKIAALLNEDIKLKTPKPVEADVQVAENRKSESKTPKPSCPKCAGPITGKGGHGNWCLSPACKWGWEVELDGSPLKPPTPSPESVQAEYLTERARQEVAMNLEREREARKQSYLYAGAIPDCGCGPCTTIRRKVDAARVQAQAETQAAVNRKLDNFVAAINQPGCGVCYPKGRS